MQYLQSCSSYCIDLLKSKSYCQHTANSAQFCVVDILDSVSCSCSLNKINRSLLHLTVLNLDLHLSKDDLQVTCILLKYRLLYRISVIQ